MKAAVFIDYNNWYSGCNRKGVRPNLEVFFHKLNKSYAIDKENIYFFGDMSSKALSEEWSRLYAFTDNIIDAYDPAAQWNVYINGVQQTVKGKNYTKFALIDAIYRTLLKEPAIEAYVLFAGDRDYQFVCKHLVECGKMVDLYGVSETISQHLRSVVEFVTEVEPVSAENANDYEYELAARELVDTLKNWSQKGEIVSFRGLARHVSRVVNVDEREVQRILSSLIYNGVIAQRTVENKGFKGLFINENK